MGQIAIETGYTIMGVYRNWTLLKIGSGLNISMISDYLYKLMRLPMSFFDKKQTGDILQRINDHNRIQKFLTDSILNVLLSAISIIIFGIAIYVYNWFVFLMFISGSILYIVWILRFMKRRAVLDSKLFSQRSADQGNLMQLIMGIQEIKLEGCEKDKLWEWECIQRGIYRLSMKSLKLSQYQQSGGMFLNQVKDFAITAFVAVLVTKGEISFGMMLSIQYIVGALNSPVNQFIQFLQEYQDSQLSLSRLQEIYRVDDEDNKNKENISESDCGDIILTNVSFQYDKYDSDKTISDISIYIPRGKTTAIVGLSGSGKTTLLKLILGFYHPDGGHITIGGKSMDSLNMHEWRQQCGTVMQDGFIFTDTIARNIAPCIANVDMQRIKEAARIANIDDFIEKLPLKYDTILGDDGHKLSLGQKQRILIARAVYKNPKYVFLDEATNSLDTSNEFEIMEHLNKFLKGRTSVIIAHRLSTVRNADQIVVIDHGKVVETGNHETLTAKRGAYYNLVKNQLELGN